MDWLAILRGAAGRLAAVRPLSDVEAAGRAADLVDHGDVVCAGCGWQGFAHQGAPGAAIFRGVYEYDEATKRFTTPAVAGRCVYECPRCHLVDDARHEGGFGGLMFLGGWMLAKGEWRLATCASPGCAGRGSQYVELSCPGCGTLMLLHHASNAPAGTHGWAVRVEGDRLTMTPSIVHYAAPGCHFFIRGGEVQWCG